MYIPKLFKNEDLASVRDFIDNNGFAILISTAEGKPWATHIPLVFYKYPDGREVLSGHVARGNKQWKSFDAHQEVLAIFQGPHSYISSSWYDHENVPTWNYTAVHVYGKIKIIEQDVLVEHLIKMVDKYEAKEKDPVSVPKMSPEFLKSQLKGITGFEIEITEIQAADKLSQNRDDKNYKTIVDELDKREDAGSKLIADLMKSTLKIQL